MGRTGQHAVVIGASIAGLCAARVLADFYDTVSVFDRDDLPEGPENRPAIPQDRHLHLLMARGALEFDTLFPGLLDDMVAPACRCWRTGPKPSISGPPATFSGWDAPCVTISPPTCPVAPTWNGSSDDASPRWTP